MAAVGPKTVEIGPELMKIGRFRAKFDRNRPSSVESEEFGMVPVEIAPKLTDVGMYLAEMGSTGSPGQMSNAADHTIPGWREAGLRGLSPSADSRCAP